MQYIRESLYSFTTLRQILLMPKQKSHSGTKKRVRTTGSGKFALNRAGRRHLLQQKSKRQKNLPDTKIISKSEHKKLKTLLPYSA